MCSETHNHNGVQTKTAFLLTTEYKKNKKIHINPLPKTVHKFCGSDYCLFGYFKCLFQKKNSTKKRLKRKRQKTVISNDMTGENVVVMKCL